MVDNGSRKQRSRKENTSANIGNLATAERASAKPAASRSPRNHAVSTFSEQKSTCFKDLTQHQRILYLATSFVGKWVEVQLKNGQTCTGIFHSKSEKDFSILLKMARMKNNHQADPTNNKKPIPMVIIQANEVSQMVVKV